MIKSFWQDLHKPILALSPMDGVTDHPFRYIQKKYGQPDLVLTEFTSVEGLCHGATRLLTDFIYDETQRPIIAQVYGTTPNFFRQAAIIVAQLGFDGIDINMGCPAKNVAHSGAGAALIKTPKLAQQIIKTTKQGIADWLSGQDVTNCPDITPDIASAVQARQNQLPEWAQERRYLPVSVKTRVGYSRPVVDEWIPTLLATEPAAISIHGRTLTQHYTGEANWEEISKAAQLAQSSSTLILGNGDIANRNQALQAVQNYGVNGVLIGRASFGNPFVFKNETNATPQQLFQIAIEHAKLYENTYQADEKYHFMPMRKHLGWYVRDFPHAKDLRIKMFAANNAADVVDILTAEKVI